MSASVRLFPTTRQFRSNHRTVAYIRENMSQEIPYQETAAKFIHKEDKILYVF